MPKNDKAIINQIADASGVNEQKGTKPKRTRTPKNKNIEEQKSKKVEGQKSKRNRRSYMISEETEAKLKRLDFALKDKDLSDIVEESINLYYEKNKKIVEEFAKQLFESI